MARKSEKRISRRKFLKAAGTGAAALGLASGLKPLRVSGQPKTLKIIQWSHFVPAYDRWFDVFAKDWGKNHTPPVDVAVDHISFADIITRANAEVAAQKGHDLFMFLAPPGDFEPHVLDLTDVVQEVEKKHGPILDLAKRSTFNPYTNTHFGFSDMWVIDPGDYRKSIWSRIGMSDGPSTWDDLLKGGMEIKRTFPQVQIPVGIGYSQDIDSNMATRAMIWSFGGAEQDESSNVVLNSPETLAALEHGVRLFRETMNPAVLSWNAASNNQAFNAGQTSYILNSISAYRAAQEGGLRLPDGSLLADDTFFVRALRGQGGRKGWASEHVMSAYVIWKFAESPDLAKEFLTYLVDNARRGVLESKLYNTPSFLGSAADPGTPMNRKVESGRRWVEVQFEIDPFGSRPADKLAVLKDALEWSTNVGHPGPANAAVGEVFNTFVIPDMFAKAATGRMTPRAALDEANARTKEIFKKWRDRGLVGGGSGDK